MRIPAIMDRYEAKEYIALMLRVYKKVYVDLSDVEVETFDDWGFYKVSLFRWSQSTAGCGDKAYRDMLWIEHKEAFRTLFKHTSESATWRWVVFETESYDTRQIEGIELCILKGNNAYTK